MSTSQQSSGKKFFWNFIATFFDFVMIYITIHVKLPTFILPVKVTFKFEFAFFQSDI